MVKIRKEATYERISSVLFQSVWEISSKLWVLCVLVFSRPKKNTSCNWKITNRSKSNIKRYSNKHTHTQRERGAMLLCVPCFMAKNHCWKNGDIFFQLHRRTEDTAMITLTESVMNWRERKNRKTWPHPLSKDSRVSLVSLCGLILYPLAKTRHVSLGCDSWREV